jgi:putative acetyltransferase
MIRPENENDIGAITAVHDQAFNGPVEGKIVENLRHNQNLILSLVFELEGKVVAHIAYSPIYDKNQEFVGLGLAPVAVLPAYQKRGIGSGLIEIGNKMAFATGFKKIFVLGDPQYYRRFGFDIAREYNYFSDFDPEGTHFMVLGEELEKASEKTSLDYGEEFNVAEAGA